MPLHSAAEFADGSFASALETDAQKLVALHFVGRRKSAIAFSYSSTRHGPVKTRAAKIVAYSHRLGDDPSHRWPTKMSQV